VPRRCANTPRLGQTDKESDMKTIPSERACNNCGIVYPVEEQYFQAITNSSDGFRKTCKPCKKAKDRERYSKLKKQTLERTKAWYQENKKKKQSYDSEYRQNNRERRKENNRKNYRRVIQELPQRYKAKTMTYNRRNFSATYKFIPKDFTRMLERQRYCCFYCGERFTNLLSLELDHVIPVKLGGVNSIGNSVLACRICNRGKSYKTVMEFRLNKVKSEISNRL